LAQDAPRRLRRAEAVLARRTGRLLLVVERCSDDWNLQAVFRTAEAMGIQHVWAIDNEIGLVKTGRSARSINKGSLRWLSLRSFADSTACLAALRADGWAIWASCLDNDSRPLTPHRAGLSDDEALPDKLAIVVGRESDGVSDEILDAADRKVMLPMLGFTQSYNLSVATALLLQRLRDALLQEGDLSEDEKAVLRKDWYEKLGKNEETRDLNATYLDNPPVPFQDVRPTEESRRPRIRKKSARNILVRGLEDWYRGPKPDTQDES